MEQNEMTTYIDAFLEGRLSETERKEFINKRENDPNFDLEVKAQLKLKETIQRSELLQNLKVFESSFIPDKTTLIDQYLNKELSEELSIYVDSKMKEDEFFTQEVKAQQHIRATLQRQQLKNQLQSFERNQTEIENIPQEEKKETKEIKFILFTPKTISLAASVLIILFVSIFFLKPSPEKKVIAQYKVVIEQKNEGLGFAGDENGEMNVEIVVEGKRQDYYQLTSNKLTLFIEEGKKIDHLKIIYDPASSPPYLLIIEDNNYFIDINNSPSELK